MLISLVQFILISQTTKGFYESYSCHGDGGLVVVELSIWNRILDFKINAILYKYNVIQNKNK